ncbi:MAG: hypothetical protein BWY85_01295 [Firmicutes bacterium ADurb.Bin506]|nr:MAG: hypothetical protein BWY85_01295 [Firmicutes bacterium ADurb.Bin506]
MSSLLDNLTEVRERISRAAGRSGRSERDVRLIAVTKTVGIDVITEAISAGLTEFGENRVQEALAKVPELPTNISWHLVGTLQRNKARHVVGVFSMVHSLDSVELARELDRRAAAIGVPIDALVQVNVAREPQKSGVAPEGAADLLRAVCGLENVRVRGLMIMAPYSADPEAARPWFRQGRQLLAQLARMNLPGVEMEQLSMGMSGDFEVAIEEGATMVRIGSALFGSRPAPAGRPQPEGKDEGAGEGANADAAMGDAGGERRAQR